MSIAITINGGTRLIEKIAGVEKLLANPKETLEEIGDLVLEEKEEQFKTQGARFNSPWAALSKATQMQKIKLGYGNAGILQRTGKLLAGFKKTVQRYKVTVSNPVKYYEYHQLGMGFNPRRPMLDTPETMKQNIVEIINKAIRKLL